MDNILNRPRVKTGVFICCLVFSSFSNPLLGRVPDKKLLDSRQFFKSSPLSRDGVVFSPSSFETIRFFQDEQVGMELAGTVSEPNEIFLEGVQIPVKDGRFETVLNVRPLKSQYEIKIRRPDFSETAYPFQVEQIREIPPPFRIRIRSGKTKPVVKEKGFSGVYPTKNWLRFIWLKEITTVLPLDKKMAKEKKELAPGQSPERALTAQTEKIQETSNAFKAREAIGLELDQGIGFLSLKQSGKTVKSAGVDSSNWIANLKLRRKFSDNYFGELMGSYFLFPLSVSGTKTGPRVFRLDLGGGASYPISERDFFVPAFGVRYQTISTSEIIGYRDIIGGKLTLGHKHTFEGRQALHTDLCLAIFSNELNQFSWDNRELGVRIALEWPLQSDLVTSLRLGGEWQTQALQIRNINLTSDFYSAFLGVLF